MNVRLEKPLKKGEVRHGVLTRESNGVAVFDETDQQWLNQPSRRALRLKRFERYGTRVSRKADRLIIKVEVAALSLGDTFGLSQELTDAVLYCSRYQERRAKR